MPANTQVLKLSLFFFLLYTADTSNSSILNFIFEKMHLPTIGPSSLLTQYFFLSLSLILTPAIRLTLKKKLLIGSLLITSGYLLTIIAVLTKKPNMITYLLVIASALNGTAAGLLWVSQGRYMHLICEIFKVQQRRGQTFGVFQLFYCLAMMCGSLVTLFCLGYFNNTVYFTFLTVLGTSSFFFNFIYLRQIQDICLDELNDKIQEGAQVRVNELQLIVVSIRQQHQAEGYRIYDLLRGFGSFVPNMFCLLLVYLVEALTTGIRLNQLTHLIPTSLSAANTTKVAGLCQVWAGIGSVSGGYLVSLLTDIIGTIWVAIIALLLFSFNSWAHILTLHLENIALTYICCFLWGFLLFGFVGLMMIIISRHYVGLPQAFAVNRLAPALFMMVYQGWMIITHNSIPWQAFIFFSLLSIPAILFLKLLPTLSTPDKA